MEGGGCIQFVGYAVCYFDAYLISLTAKLEDLPGRNPHRVRNPITKEDMS